jgi:hypothetical protein
MNFEDLKFDEQPVKKDKEVKITFFRLGRGRELQISLENFLNLHPIRLH